MVFSYFLQFKFEFCNMEFMIWATVSYWSCFCWMYRAYPSLTAKNIINMISVMTTWWCPCVESCVVVRGCLLWPVHFIGKTPLAFSLLHFVHQGQVSWYSRYLDFLLLPSSLLWWKWHLFFLVFVILVIYIIFQKVKTYAKAVFKLLFI